jgi:DNA-binding PadR family transcriptional regulator
VYTTLNRLEEKGLLESRRGEPTPLRGGRRKRYFEVTGAGQRTLRQSVSILRQMARGLDVGWEAP